MFNLVFLNIAHYAMWRYVYVVNALAQLHIPRSTLLRGPEWIHEEQYYVRLLALQHVISKVADFETRYE